MPIDGFNYQIVLYTLRWGKGGVVLPLKIAFKALKIPIIITINLNFYLDSTVRSKTLM